MYFVTISSAHKIILQLAGINTSNNFVVGDNIIQQR